VLIQLGSKDQQGQTLYEPAFQLGLDMLQRLGHHQEIVTALVSEDCVMRALDYAQEHSVHGMRLSGLIDNVEMARDQGNDCKA
jgi:hypothetical protein